MKSNQKRYTTAYLVHHSHHLTHVQVFHRGAQVSDGAESQAAVPLVGGSGRYGYLQQLFVYIFILFRELEPNKG